MMMRKISWVKRAKKDFLKFPETVQIEMATALDLSLEGKKAEIVKPLSIFGSGVFEIALQYRTNVFRAIYAVKIDKDIWVLHAFQKKSKKGIQTPKQEFNLVKSRIKALKESLK